MSERLPDLDEYRQRARIWLAANLPERTTGSGRGVRGIDHKTRENVQPEREKQRILFDAGYAGIAWPKEYGGQGLPSVYQRTFNEEAADYAMPDFGILGGATAVCSTTMLAHASPQFLERHIPAILRGEELFAQFFSEPGGGSDLAGVTTRADRDGDHWILNGAKIWSSGAYYADWGMCLARTNWDVPKHRGLTWFAVKIDTPGVTVREIREINGDTEFCEEFFDDVVVPDAERISEVDEGWRVTQTMLVHERGGGGDERVMASSVAAPTERLLAPDLVAAAKRAGRDNDPVARQLIAKAHINDFARLRMAVRAGSIIRTGKDPAGVAGYVKLMSGWYGSLRARLGIELGRGAVLTWAEGDLDARATSHDYLNGRMMAIAGGTNEMQRNGIGERVLGLPREPSFDTNKPFRDVVRNARNWSSQIG